MDGDGGESREQMSLGELTDAADVSVRTVRYYIAEGLLPPPQGAGPASAYGAGHLDRLRLIQRLKQAYLPLKEIRRRLAGLDDDQVRELLRKGSQDVVLSEQDMVYDVSLADARDYLTMLESRERYRTEPMALPFAPAQSPSPSAPAPDAAMDFDAAPQPARRRGPRAAGGFPARAVDMDRGIDAAQDRDERATGGLWHRIPLGDEAELVISDRVYARHRDRVDWLVRWARKVFG